MSRIDTFATEAELVEAFCLWNQSSFRTPWRIYHETAGWDVLAVCPETGVQVGIEAKLSLNAKVVSQALPGHSQWSAPIGPDYRAVLVPAKGCQNHIAPICKHLGLTVMAIHGDRCEWRQNEPVRWYCNPHGWPDETSNFLVSDWFPWLPGERHTLPDYVPDVTGGHAAPVMLTPWKIKAIKLLILLDRFGAVTRKDMKALGISPTRWTACGYGFLVPGADGYVRCTRTPDLRAQHPINYAEIEADYPVWGQQVRPVIDDFEALL